MPRRMTQEEFIAKAEKIWGDKLDFSNVIYVNNYTNINVKCNVCGECFTPKPDNILHRHGCPNCGNNKKMTQESFLEKAKLVHGSRYDYSKVVFISRMKEVTITCKEHGDFQQTPKNHLSGKGCFECAKKTMGSARLDIEDFKTKAAEIHKGKYDYSKVLSIKNNREKVLIICPIHGEFPQTPHNHLSGQGCPYCSPWSMPKTKENFIKEARGIHGYKYDYTYVEYKRLTNKVKIVCKKCGNIFEQSASSHLAGAGCPHCIQSRGETRVRLTLDKLRVKYEEQKIFQTPIAPGQKHLFRVDFFVPGKNLIIEYNGEQHYIARRIVTKKSLERQQKRDEALRRFCKEANIDLLEIPYTDFKNIDSILYKKIRAHV